MKQLSLAISLLLFTSSAFANWCVKSYRYENFWISAAKSFGENVQRNQFLDEGCWKLGGNYGEQVKANNSRNNSACKSAFSEGKNDGLQGITDRSSAPQSCYDLGVRYGLSLLTSNARLGKNISSDTRSNCVRSYQQGKSHGIKDIVAQPEQGDISSVCYMSGFQDGVLFRGVL